MKAGDHVWLELEGRRVRAEIMMASPNERSLMVRFEALLGGYAGMMPLLKDDHGVYRDLIEQRPVEVIREI
jgi:hypothetical protein